MWNDDLRLSCPGLRIEAETATMTVASMLAEQLMMATEPEVRGKLPVLDEHRERS